MIINKLIIFNKFILVVDADPSVSGVKAGDGSLAILSFNGVMYVKSGPLDTDWTIQVTPAISSAFLNGGNAFGAPASLGTTDNFDLSIITNNIAAMTILANGNVGIGAASPSEKLEVNGNIRLDASGSGDVVLAANATTTPYTFVFPADAGTAGFVLKTDGAGNTSWAVDSAPAGTPNTIAFFDSSGNLNWDPAFGWDDSLKFMNVGDLSGAAPAPSGQPIIYLTSEGTSATDHGFKQENVSNSFGSAYAGLRARTTLATPSAILSGDTLVAFQGYGYDGTAYGANPDARILMSANQPFSSGNHGTDMIFQITASGSASIKSNFAANGAGGISIYEATGATRTLTLRASGSLAPSGVTLDSVVRNDIAAKSLGIWTSNGTTSSGQLRIETGNASAGSSGNIVLQSGTATGTSGIVSVSGRSLSLLNHAGAHTPLRLYPDADSTNYVSLSAPALGAPLDLFLPAVDGSFGNIIQTDGAGQLSFVGQLNDASSILSVDFNSHSLANSSGSANLDFSGADSSVSLVDAHLGARQSGSLGVAAQAAAGAGATASVSNANDVAGHVQIIPGTGTSAGVIVEITFITPYAVAPIAVLTPSDQTSVSYTYWAETTTSVLRIGIDNIFDGDTINLNYMLIQTQ